MAAAARGAGDRVRARPRPRDARRATARAHGALRGRLRAFVDYLLPAHITALAVSMLLFANDRMAPIVFGTAVAIGSKWIVARAGARRLETRSQPVERGIAAALLLFPSVGITPPYQFTENFAGAWHWLVPGDHPDHRFVHQRALQRPRPADRRVARGVRAARRRCAVLFAGAAPIAPFVPMTGAAFVLFTMYMITDPSTTPLRAARADRVRAEQRRRSTGC